MPTVTRFARCRIHSGRLRAIQGAPMNCGIERPLALPANVGRAQNRWIASSTPSMRWDRIDGIACASFNRNIRRSVWIRGKHRTGGVTAAMIDCIGAETQRQDVRLNKAYKDVMPSLPATRQKQLQEVQRIWIAQTVSD